MHPNSTAVAALLLAAALSVPGMALGRDPIKPPKNYSEIENNTFCSGTLSSKVPSLQKWSKEGKVPDDNTYISVVTKELTDWFNSSLKPKLIQATTDDTAMPCAACGFLNFMKALELLAVREHFDHKIINFAENSLIKVYRNAINQAYQRCVSEKDPYQGTIIIALLKESEFFIPIDNFAGYVWRIDNENERWNYTSTLANEYCQRFYVRFTSTVDYRQIWLGVSRHSRFQIEKAELNYKKEGNIDYWFSPKRGRGTITDDWLDPTATPTEWTEQRNVRLDIPYVSMGFRTELPACQGPKPDKVFPMIQMGYTPEGTGGLDVGLWSMDYYSLHRDDFTSQIAAKAKTESGEPLDISIHPLMKGLLEAHDFQKGSGEVFAKKTYNKTSTITDTLITVEETTIEIVHDPKVLGKPPIRVPERVSHD